MNVEKYCCFDLDVNMETKHVGQPRFRAVNRKPLDWKSELIQTAIKIRASTDRPLFVCMSGGIDGEVVGNAFLLAGIPFEVITLRHMQHTNEHDIAYTLEWCRVNRVKQHVIPFDVVDFFVNRIWEYNERGYDAGNRSYLSYTTMYLIDLVESMGGSAVIGNGETRFITQNGVVSMDVRAWWYNNMRYIEEQCTGIHFPWFFKTTSELVASYLDEDLIKILISDPMYFTCPPLSDLDITEKPLIYHKYFPNMPRRPKYTGWENIQTSIPEIKTWLDKFHGRSAGMLSFPAYIPVTKVKEQLWA